LVPNFVWKFEFGPSIGKSVKYVPNFDKLSQWSPFR